VADDNAAQGAKALATFVWEAREAPATTTTTVPPAINPSIPSTGSPESGQPVLGSEPTAEPAPSEPAATTGSASSGPRRPAPQGSLVPRQEGTSGSVVSAIGRGALFVVERSAFLGVLLVVAGVFLLVQDRIDRKDPKLALAPIHPDPELPFGP
jgi:hypothetical protein